MFLTRTTFKSLAIFWIIVLATAAASQQPKTPPKDQEKNDNDRAIIADDFLKNRPGRSKRTPRKPQVTYTGPAAAAKRSDQPREQVGVTIWRLEQGTPGSATGARSMTGNTADWIPKRVQADLKFRQGDAIRISIESPRDGYLYVVNRDVLADGSYGESNLIFPTQDEDNRLKAGRLIDIPAPDDPPFTATPKADQSSELLTIIVTSSPLQLPLRSRAIPISEKQLADWEKRWGAAADRLEMNGGAGQARTSEELLAASPSRTRQLTRNDPMPQTIYSLSPRNPDALLFNIVLSYVR